MPPGATAIVYASDGPVIVPVSDPFSSTVPLGSARITGPVTALPDCVSVHVVRAVTPWKLRSPAQRPVTSICVGAGVVGVLLLSHAANRRVSSNATTMAVFRTNGGDARFVPVVLCTLEEAR